MGNFASVVKSFIKPAHHLRFRTPHATFVQPKGQVCLMDEYMACPKVEAMPFVRQPPSADKAFVLHLHCATLLDWVRKKSVVGRVDTVSLSPRFSPVQPKSNASTAHHQHES